MEDKNLVRAYVKPLTERELKQVEIELHGPMLCYGQLKPLSSYISIKTLYEYSKYFHWALVHLGPDCDGKSKWTWGCSGSKCVFSDSSEYTIKWEHKTDPKEVEHLRQNINPHNFYSNRDCEHYLETTTENLYARHLCAALQMILENASSKQSKGHKAGQFLEAILAIALMSPSILGEDYEISRTQEEELAPIYTSLLKARHEEERVEAREKQYNDFMEKYNGAEGLVVVSSDGSRIIHVDGLCGFDIHEKERELNEYIAQQEAEHQREQEEFARQQAEQRAREEKIRNSQNAGEEDVEYALKWILAANKGMFVPIIGDCESNHRINCIWLKNPDFINEPQEFDHILVCPAGVISIETKHWKDRVVIREDGKWLRQTDSTEYGVESPKMQVQRHEALLQSILPDVPIFSLICFSNSSIVIEGRENFDAYPLLLIENLDDALKAICSAAIYSADEVQQIVATIEAHKVGNK